MLLDDLLVRFAAIPGASVGRGVDHPEEPHPELSPELDAILEEYPQLAAIEGYSDFLRAYGGASVREPGKRFYLWVYGYAGETVDFSELDFPVVSDNGFIQFAEWSFVKSDRTGVDDALECHYAFDLTGDRPPGVYEEHKAVRQPPTEYTLLYPSFTAWLQRVVDTHGAVHPVP